MATGQKIVDLNGNQIELKNLFYERITFCITKSGERNEPEIRALINTFVSAGKIDITTPHSGYGPYSVSGTVNKANPVSKNDLSDLIDIGGTAIQMTCIKLIK